MTEDKNFRQRSPEVQEIIGQIPPWVIRWGMTAVFTAVLILVLLSFLISYPDTVDVKVRIINDEQGVFAVGNADERFFSDILLGQRVYIKLTGFAYEEFGVLNGKIIRKTALDEKGIFKIVVSIPEGLKTSYKKDLKYYDNMTGNAEVVLEDMRLIDRLLHLK